MAKKKDKNLDLDLNKDGVFDGKDKSLAAKALATKLPEKDVKDEKEIKDEVSVEPEALKEEEKEDEAPEEDLGDVSEEIKEFEEEEVKDGDRVCVKAISRTYRKGDIVPAAQIARWEECGINYKVWF